MYACPPHLYTVATLPWEIQRSHFPTVLFMHTSDSRSLRKNKLLLPYPPHLKNVTSLPYKKHKFFIFHLFTHIEYQSVIRTSCISVLLRHGLNFSRAGGWCSWSVAKKTGSMYPCRRWSLWTFAVTLLAWHSICHTSQLVLFRATNANPQPAFSQSHQSLEECKIPSARWKSCALYKVVGWHFSGVVGKGVTVCFLLR